MTTENTNTENTNEATKPDYCPDKFWNAETKTVNHEALAKSYVELEKKLGAKQPAVERPDAKPAGKQLAEIAGDLNKQLSAADYIALDKLGFDREEVEDYRAAKQAKVVAKEQAMFDVAGGKEQFEGLLKWAGASLSDADLETLNDGLQTGGKSAILAVKWLTTEYTRVNGKDPKVVVSGGKSSTTEGAGFASIAETAAAMQNTLYKGSSAEAKAYTKEVLRKLANKTY